MNQALLEMFNNGSLEQLKDKYVEDKSWIDLLISIIIDGFLTMGLRWWEKADEDLCAASTRTSQLGFDLHLAQIIDI